MSTRYDFVAVSPYSPGKPIKKFYLHEQALRIWIDHYEKKGWTVAWIVSDYREEPWESFGEGVYDGN